MTDNPRLIEHAFPLNQASLNSVHEKNVRHGHISTLHIWPVRWRIAVCRAETGDFEVSANEWVKACNMRQGYWLYAIYGCAKPSAPYLRAEPVRESTCEGERERSRGLEAGDGGLRRER
jgi:hypothetical protein